MSCLIDLIKELKTVIVSGYEILLHRNQIGYGVCVGGNPRKYVSPDFSFYFDFGVFDKKGTLVSFFYGSSSPRYYQHEASGFKIFYQDGVLYIRFNYFVDKHMFKEISIEEGEVEVIQKNGVLKIINNGNLIFQENVRMSFQHFDRGDFVIGCSDYYDGRFHRYFDFGSFCLNKLEVKILSYYVVRCLK